MNLRSSPRRLIAALAALVFAALPPSAIPQNAPRPATPIPASEAWMTRLVTLDAEEAALPSVLKILAEKGDLNIITGPGVSTGRITIHMKDVPIEQAVNLVVRAAGLAYERIGNSILVASPESLKEETGLSSYVVNLQFADATEVMNALAGVKAEITVDKGGNRLIVVTSPRVLSEIQSIVARLDVPARQVMLEARIVEVSTDALKRLGIDWDQIMSKGFLFIEGEYDSISGSGNRIEGLQVFPNTPGTNDIFKAKTFSRQATFFNVQLDLLIRDGNARVLASPKLVTLNGREASMLVGSRVPFVVTGTLIAGGGAAPVQSIQREEVGVKLRITPLINADGFITTTISPEVSSITGFTGENNDLPIVATRQASTTVRLKDGDSVIIGGLLSEERTTTTSKVPILGDIPGLGYFFQHQNIVTGKKDLVIEVTPRILPGP